MPHAVFITAGLSISRAPAFLKPFLDCTDGAILKGYDLRPGGVVTASRWELHRGGQIVGLVSIDMAGAEI